VIIVCGPNGIGKTTLLESLVNSRKDQWDICRLSGASTFNYETVIIDLCHFLNLSDTRNSFDIASLNAYCERQKVILIIDDAGLLAPGLIDALVGLSESISGLRLVFAMTYDEFHIKVVTDKALEDSHSIELPALTEKQCGEYLQNLSAQPGALLALKEVTESLVTAIYRETHGIPGRILAEIPKLNQYQKRSNSRIGLWISVAFIVLIAGWFMKTLTPPNILNKNSPQTGAEQQIIIPIALPKASVPDKVEVEKPVSAEQSTAPAPVQNPVLTKMPEEEKPSLAITSVEPASAVSNPPKAKNNDESSEILITKPTTQKPGALPSNIKAAEPVAKPEVPAVIPQPSTSPPLQPIKKSSEPKTETEAGADGNVDWILAQPAENYTLQVMVLSTKAAAQRFLKKYPEYSDRLKYYVINKSTQQKFVLIYGTFASSAEAKNSKADLPAEFKYSLEKRFKLIQNESRR
jgi:DamX protein